MLQWYTGTCNQSHRWHTWETTLTLQASSIKRKTIRIWWSEIAIYLMLVPIIVVNKKSGTLRLCVDHCHLNKTINRMKDSLDHFGSSCSIIYNPNGPFWVLENAIWVMQQSCHFSKINEQHIIVKLQEHCGYVYDLRQSDICPDSEQNGNHPSL